MFDFIKKWFKKEAEVRVNLTDDIDPDTAHGFEIVLGMEAAPSPGNVNIRINKVALLATNETGRMYIEKMDDRLLKVTIATLCRAAIQHVVMSKQSFIKNIPSDPDPVVVYPPIDKSHLN